jgi:hypothetical protein
MKKVAVFLIMLSMLCVSITSAGFISRTEDDNDDDRTLIASGSIDDNSIEACTSRLEQTVNEYSNMDPNRFKPHLEQDQPISLPWRESVSDNLLEWWVTMTYNGKTVEKKVDISITDFQENFLKHPEYYLSLKFNVDDDDADDLEVFIGFYWSVIAYPDGQEGRSLESRFRVRQTSSDYPGGGVQDQTAGLEVWSEVRVNYGLIKIPKIKSKSIPFEKSPWLKSVFLKIIDKFNAIDGLPIIKNLLNRIINKNNKDTSSADINALASDGNSDSDYIRLGLGYRSPKGEQIPLLVEKRFAFAKCFNYNWQTEGNLFNPTIFEHELYEVTSTDPITLLYGFKAVEGATDTTKFDIAFTSRFDNSNYIMTHYIPMDAYVYWYFDSKSKASNVVATFSADVNVGQAISVPEIVLEFDNIDDTLARSGRWFSIDADMDIFGGDLFSFHYRASHKFNVGIKVNVPSLFEEKVQIKGIPTSVDIGWDVYANVKLIPVIDVTFGGTLKCIMNSNIDQVLVFYPKSDTTADDEVFASVKDIPATQSFRAEASLYINTQNNQLHVKPSGLINMQMSSSIGEINVYYPKAVANDPNLKFLYIPGNSIPSRAQINGLLEVYLANKNDISGPNNYIYGTMSHDCSSNIHRVDFYLPSEQTTPVIKLTEMPADSAVEGKLYFNRLEGYASASRGSAGGIDPVDLNLEYGGFAVKNHLAIDDGQVSSSFKVAMQDGYFNLDTSDDMFSNTLDVYYDDQQNNYKDIKMHLAFNELSVDNLRTSWDIDTSGDKIKITDLGVSGVIKTLRNLHTDFTFQSKTTWLEIDWITGEKGNLVFDFKQEAPININFDIIKDIATNLGITVDGYIKLYNNPHFDIFWQWKQGDSPTDPGYFKINEKTNEPQIDDMYLLVKYDANKDGTDEWGAEVTLDNVGIYVCVEWYWYNLRLFIWPVIKVSGTVDLNLLLNGKWYYNVEDWVNPP